ncbi:MAG: arsenate reductase ArsC [Anaerolineales bacterium]|nr:arsenate reductase ArsC [Anaerolineales bacterium]MCB8953243.1 arsenate reductase ArsC [Ardenticatenales bacterium]
MKRKRVLFLCTGNSCRSQMAEAMVNGLMGDVWEAESAGISPTHIVHPLALHVLAEINIETGRLYSKSVEPFRRTPFDFVITVCDDAHENCPLWPGQGRILHLGFPDPATATGSEEEKLAVFRHVRDDIRARVLSLLDQLAIATPE